MRAHGVVADTHAIVWYLDSPVDLSAAATNALDNAANDETQRIYISAISLIEMQYLTEKGKIKPAVLPKVMAEIDEPQPITPKAFDLLLALVEQHGHLLEKDELLRKRNRGL